MLKPVQLNAVSDHADGATAFGHVTPAAALTLKFHPAGAESVNAVIAYALVIGLAMVNVSLFGGV